MAKLTQQQLETHLWGAANILRNRTAGQDYKTYILSLIFFKRLSDQWDYEAEAKIRELEKDRNKPFTDVQRRALLQREDLHRFKIPEECHWSDVLKEAKDIGQALDTAMQGIARANKELAGVFTVHWNAPAPDGQGKLIANTVVHALVQHFHDLDLSNANVQPDILGRAYEYLIKQFADDAGAKAGEFFTPPEVVDCLVRMLEPQAHETVYDPTCGSGGMLVHSAEFIAEQEQKATMQVRYYGQEMNWSTYAIARINMILHDLEADIRGGKSTISDPLHLNSKGGLKQFGVVLANFPFSDEMWWLPDDQRTEEQAKKAKKALNKKKDGPWFKDKYNRFIFGTPPASYGDYAFIQHIIASLTENGRAGVVCPQGVLFRGQPEVEEETGEFDEDGTPIVRRRKADDEYLIRKGLLEARLIDAAIALPLNIFYGAGVPACLLILSKGRPKKRRDKVLLIYAARHCRELANKNQLRPQDVMRILVHYHAYGGATKAEELVMLHSTRLKEAITREEEDEIGRVLAEYEPHDKRLAQLEADLGIANVELAGATHKSDEDKRQKLVSKILGSIEKTKHTLSKRDERIAEVSARAAEDRDSIQAVGQELISMYGSPEELSKNARVIDFAEITDNEYNLNIPRYVDTFEPEPAIDVAVVVRELEKAEVSRLKADAELMAILAEVGYETK